ncbi:MAG: hypothetical protein KF724_10870 [Phycisphaeraceae bacterium]|nr:hypothetical protein [Phycisphaeraceae bacterium]
MTALPSSVQPVPWTPAMARVEGDVLASAFEAIVKGVLEAESPVRTIASPRRAPFEPIFRLLGDETSRRTLEQHRVEVVDGGDGARSVAMVDADAARGESGVALVPNDHLERAMPALERLAARVRQRRSTETASSRGVAVVVIEDNPDLSPSSCPRHAAQCLDLPCLEPSDVESLRDTIDDALRIAAGAGGAAIIAVHVSILRSLETIRARPNRVLDRVDALLALRRERRAPRGGEGLDVMRLARRMELNLHLSLPSPGEREPWGLIAVGPCLVAAQHVLRELGLTGRIPLMRLGLVHPVDPAALLRLLQRCENVLVLEPRPGSVALSIATAAEEARASGEQPSLLWWHRLPPDEEQHPASLDANDALRPSILARRIVHLLHAVRPNLGVASRLEAAQPEAERVVVPRRGAGIGVASAIDLSRQLIAEVAKELSEERAEEVESPRIALVVADQPTHPGERQVLVEIWERRRFALEGAGAIRQAVASERARIFVLCDLAADDEPDPERLARAVVPIEGAARLLVERADLNDRGEARAMLRRAAEHEGVTLALLRDGPPPRRDVALLERSAVEIDRLGFAPTQRLIWSAETACELRPLSTAALVERGLERGSDPVRTEFTVRVESEEGAWVPSIRARPLLEQVEVVRTRPPRWRVEAGERRMAPPQPVHGRAGLWRAHFAGYRGEPPGIAAAVVSEAGRAMGYRVQATWHTAPIGPGRRSWSQVLFTRLAPGEDAVVAAGIPYGEADLIVGMDGVEALRAMGPDPLLRVARADRTWAVVNSGGLVDQVDDASLAALEQLEPTALGVCRPDGVFAADVARTLRRGFLSDRVIDLTLLGVSFQRGLIPVRLEAIEAALRRVESRGYGRSLEAFEAGRRLALRPDRPDRAARERAEPLPRLARRLVLELGRDGRGGRRMAPRLRWLLEAQLARMPELDRSEEGRAAQRDLVVALHRAVMFGGLSYAQALAEQIAAVHRADPDTEEKTWTRLSILPLAELWLPRDLLYVTTMSTSIEQHRRTRDQLEIRTSRGDRIERRYLNRVELTAFGRRFRLDFRSSDWPARLVRSLRGLVPMAARGAPEDRQRRDVFVALLERACSEPDQAEQWSVILRRMHERALDGSIRRLTPEEFESLARRA